MLFRTFTTLCLKDTLQTQSQRQLSLRTDAPYRHGAQHHSMPCIVNDILLQQTHMHRGEGEVQCYT